MKKPRLRNTISATFASIALAFGTVAAPPVTPVAVAAGEDLVVNETTVPSAEFRAYLEKYADDLNGEYVDGVYVIRDVGLVERLDGKGTQDILLLDDVSGIDNFFGLKSLVIEPKWLNRDLHLSSFPSLKKLTVNDWDDEGPYTLDFSGGTTLEYLNIWADATKINLADNPNLLTLEIMADQLPELDISRNPKLKDLYIESDTLTTLDVSNNEDLETIRIGSDGIDPVDSFSSIDVTQNRALKSLEISTFSEDFTQLNVASNPELEELIIPFSGLTELDVTRNPKLTHLRIQSSNLADLDLTRNPALSKLSVQGSPLKSLDVTQNPELTELWVGYNKLTSLDVSQNPKLVSLSAVRNMLTSLDISENPELAGLDISENNLFAIDSSANPKLVDINGGQINEVIPVNGETLRVLTELLPPEIYLTKDSSWNGATWQGDNLIIDTQRPTLIDYATENGITRVFDPIYLRPLTVIGSDLGITKAEWTSGPFAPNYQEEPKGSTIIDFSKIQNLAPAKGKVTITSEPIAGYHVKEWVVNGKVHDNYSPDNTSTIFTMPDAPVTIETVFELTNKPSEPTGPTDPDSPTSPVDPTDPSASPQPVDPSANPQPIDPVDPTDVHRQILGAGGTAQFSADMENDQVVLTAEQKEGFTFVGWKVTAGKLTLPDVTANPLTFTVPAGGTTLEPIYKADDPGTTDPEADPNTDNPTDPDKPGDTNPDGPTSPGDTANGSDNGSAELDPGAIAGIIIGVIALLAAIGGGAYFALTSAGLI